MEKGLHAIFYEYKYYLLPDGLTLDEVKQRQTVRLSRLCENLCMAPDFVYESMREETLTLEAPERAFEVIVNLYTQEEYNEILGRFVERNCPGCVRYQETGTPDLNGHHREMALNGVCYERRGENEDYPYSRRVEWFWYRVSLMLDELSACIDKNKQKKLNELLEDLTKKVGYPIRYYGTVHGGKYCLCLSAERALPPAYANILSYIAAVANYEKNEMREAGWTVFPYFPQGVFQYDGKKSYRDDEPALYLVPAEYPAKFSVYIYHAHPEKLSEKKQSALIDETHDRIRAAIGEDKELLLIDGYAFGTEQDRARSLNEVSEALLHAFEEDVDGMQPTADDATKTFPGMLSYGMNEPLDDESALPYKKFVAGGVTSAYEISFLDRSNLSETPWWMDFAAYAYLVFPVEGDATELFNVIAWYMTNLELVPEPLRDPDDTGISAMSIGYGETEHCVFLDNMVFDERRFFRTLRILAPVLRNYHAKVVVVNPDGVMSYVCDYEFTPEEG